MNSFTFLSKITPSIKAVSTDATDFFDRRMEVLDMLKAVENTTFTTRGAAKKLTGLTYLAGVNSSAKIVKGSKKDYNTLVLYLAAADLSGFNVCPMATDGCKKACLVASGRARMVSKGQKINSITWARLKKTWLFYFAREFFNAWLFAEIEAAKQKSVREGKNFAVRLNGTSDINIKLFAVSDNVFGEKVTTNVLEAFPNVQFYDYTKVVKQLQNSATYENYDVTFSFANTTQHNNISNTLTALALGCKVSVVFDLSTFPESAFPKKFMGYDVANGDETDLTFLQENQVLGLNFKKTGHEPSGNDFILSYDMYQQLNQSTNPILVNA